MNNGNSILYKKPYSNINFSISEIIWIKINNFDTIYDTGTKSYFLNKVPINKNLPIQEIFSFAPIPYLNRLDIELFDEVGVPYNTNMMENSFTLEIIWYSERLYGTDIQSRVGPRRATVPVQ